MNLLKVSFKVTSVVITCIEIIYKFEKKKFVKFLQFGGSCLSFQMEQHFPAEGMPCPVIGCSTEHFRKFKTLVFHWKKYHEQFVTLYRCQVCQKDFGRKNDANQHLKRKHHMVVLPWHKQNSLYIHPGYTTMPAPPVPEQPIPKPRSAERDAAAAERLRIAEEAKSSPLYALSQRGTHAVTRDEKVVCIEGHVVKRNKHVHSKRLLPEDEEVVLDYHDFTTM